MKKEEIVSLDLPREQLLGWIGKQLAGGLRGAAVLEGEVVYDGEKEIEKLRKVLKLKKEIVRTSKEIAGKFNEAVSQEWRNVELRHMLTKAKIRREKLAFQKECMESGDWIDLSSERGGILIIQLTQDQKYKNVVSSLFIPRAQSLSTEISSVWENLYSKFTKELTYREKQDAVMRESFQTQKSTNGESVSLRRNCVFEDNLHERYLLKKQREKRRELEQCLKERIASLAAELHSLRDLDRIKVATEEAKVSQLSRHVEASERMLEWQLMEQEIALQKELSLVDEKYDSKIKRVHSEVKKLRNVANIEQNFIREKDAVIDSFKADISELRRDVRDIEATITKFRSALRKQDKIRRDEAKILRE